MKDIKNNIGSNSSRIQEGISSSYFFYLFGSPTMNTLIDPAIKIKWKIIMKL